MKLTITEQIAATPQDVFEHLTDFDRLLGQSTGETTRIDRLDYPAPVSHSTRWDGRFHLFGLHRTGTAWIETLTPPEGYRIVGEADGLRGNLTVELTEVAAETTSLTVTVVLKPTSLTGRMIVQSLSLIRHKVSSRFRARLQRFAREIELPQT